jgi:HK97 gp10 family phage protein
MSVNWYGPQVVDAVKASAEDGLNKLSEAIAKTARDSMRLPKHGKHYKGAVTRSSAPYEPPAIQTAALKNSVQWVKPRELTRHVGSFGLKTGKDDAKYPLYLELGTSKMDPRPWLRPALYEHTGRTGEELWEDLLE